MDTPHNQKQKDCEASLTGHVFKTFNSGKGNIVCMCGIPVEVEMKMCVRCYFAPFDKFKNTGGCK